MDNGKSIDFQEFSLPEMIITAIAVSAILNNKLNH